MHSGFRIAERGRGGRLVRLSEARTSRCRVVTAALTPYCETGMPNAARHRAGQDPAGPAADARTGMSHRDVPHIDVPHMEEPR